MQIKNPRNPDGKRVAAYRWENVVSIPDKKTAANNADNYGEAGAQNETIRC